MTEETRIIDAVDKAFDDYMWMTQDPENAIETAIKQHHAFMKERIRHAVLMALHERGNELFDVAWDTEVTTESYQKAKTRHQEIMFQLTGKHEGEW